MGDRVVPTFFCIIFTLIAGGAQAQTATDASDSKRVQVLQIKEGTAPKEIAVKKPKSASAHKKKLRTGITSVKPKQQQVKRHRPHRTTFQGLLPSKLERFRLVTA